MNKFNYLIEKIMNASIIEEPFRHIHIHNFLHDEDLNDLINSNEIKIEKASSDTDLIEKLISRDYKLIDFPGCTQDLNGYLNWHRTKETTTAIHSATSGYGLAFRLQEYKENSILAEFDEFAQSDNFAMSMLSKFNVKVNEYTTDIGVQKFLDGYEISPHPDIRRKAITFMFNINPHDDCEKLNHHTKYLKFKNKYKYIQDLWSNTNKIERSWVPWSWCTVEKEQKENNSIVIFSPSNRSLHAVKADYNHLNGQRTLLYGNIWGEPTNDLRTMSWEHMEELRILRERNL